MALQPSLPQDAPSTTAKPSKALIVGHATNEIVFAVVGHVGSGTSTIATTLKNLLENHALPGGKYEVGILKARGIIEEWAKKAGEPIPSTPPNDLDTTTGFQDLGDKMRRRSRQITIIGNSSGANPTVSEIANSNERPMTIGASFKTLANIAATPESRIL